jgi:ketosteroid isomerase-like protein
MDAKLRKTRPFIILFLVLCFPLDFLQADEQSMETEQVIRSLFEAFNRHDTDALVTLYSTEAILFSPGDSEPQIGHEAVREIYQDHFDNIPGVHDAVQNIVAAGERGAVEFIASWEQPSADDPNARGNLRIASFITVKNGKIVKDVTYFDRVELAENMKFADEG